MLHFAIGTGYKLLLTDVLMLMDNISNSEYEAEFINSIIVRNIDHFENKFIHFPPWSDFRKTNI